MTAKQSTHQSNPRYLRHGIALGLLCALNAPGALADGFYIGAGAYLTDLEVLTESEDDVTPAAFLGYQFLDSNVLMLSAELGYYDLGSASGTIETVDYSVDAEAYTLAGVAYLPLGPFFELYGKAGLASVRIDATLNDQELGQGRIAEDGSEVFVGVGAAFDILDTIDIYAEYLYFDNEIESQMVGVGIRFDFF
jgi:opacity protein-like surface antigen